MPGGASGVTGRVHVSQRAAAFFASKYDVSVLPIQAREVSCYQRPTMKPSAIIQPSSCSTYTVNEEIECRRNAIK